MKNPYPDVASFDVHQFNLPGKGAAVKAYNSLGKTLTKVQYVMVDIEDASWDDRQQNKMEGNLKKLRKYLRNALKISRALDADQLNMEIGDE